MIVETLDGRIQRVEPQELKIDGLGVVEDDHAAVGRPRVDADIVVGELGSDGGVIWACYAEARLGQRGGRGRHSTAADR